MTEYYYRQLQNIIQPAVNQASFTTVNFLNLSIPVPPLEIQEQFASFVEQTDKSKLAIQNSLEKLETLKKALMQKYFG
jgi:type I restriction enzyme S subunit